MTRVFVSVQVGAKRSEVSGLHGGDPRVRLAAKPVDGAANEELIRFLSRELGVRRDSITMVVGRSARRKLLDMPQDAVERLVALANSAGKAPRSA